MKVLMVTPSYYPIRGGTEIIVRNLSIELNKTGVHTDIMTFNMDRKWNPKWKGKIEAIDGVTVFKVPGLNWFPIEHSPRFTLGVNLIPGRFMNILKRYDVVHFHDEFSFSFFSFFVRKPKIFHLHGMNADFFKRYHLNRIILKHVADLYISISRLMEKDLARLGIRKEKIVYLPNSVNTQLFCPQERKEDDLLLFVGRITFSKGLHVILESLRHIKKSVRLMIIGPVWSHKYYQDILKLIEMENREGKHEIIYLGAMDQEDMLKWYQKASIFILPSFGEGFPVVIIEALSCETPVVATPVGGIPEIVRNHKNGILVPQGNPLRLAEAIQHLLNNKDVRIRLGREGRKSVIRNFSSEVVVKKLCKIYNAVINR